MIKLKYVPNILSIVRIVLSLPLLIIVPFTPWFMVLYALAGITDMIDGPLARRTGSVTALGANLDASADILLALIVLFRVIPFIEISAFAFAWVFVVIGIKLLAIFISFARHKEFVLLHTYANKFVAFAAFLFPLFYVRMDANVLLLILCALASVAFFEEVLINSFSKEPKRDVKSFFFRKSE